MFATSSEKPFVPVKSDVTKRNIFQGLFRPLQRNFLFLIKKAFNARATSLLMECFNPNTCHMFDFKCDFDQTSRT